MRPWCELEPVHLLQLRGLRGVLTDIDDTLTREGRLEPAALDALKALAAAGLPVIAVTGRPAGWSEPCALHWPLTAVVAENGAVLLSAADRALQRLFVDDEPTRAAHQRRLQACARAILTDVPGATLARDSAGRLTDIAIDHSEFADLDADAVGHVVTLMRAHGLTATVSSIHINGWLGTHSKWTGAGWAVRRCLGQTLKPHEWLYVGDSTNDQIMFEHLPLSVGVANIARFVPALATRPAYVTQAERGAGFAEVAARVVAARR